MEMARWALEQALFCTQIIVSQINYLRRIPYDKVRLIPVKQKLRSPLGMMFSASERE